MKASDDHLFPDFSKKRHAKHGMSWEVTWFPAISTEKSGKSGGNIWTNNTVYENLKKIKSKHFAYGKQFKVEISSDGIFSFKKIINAYFFLKICYLC